MAHLKTYKLTDLTIGSKVYVVHKDYANKKRPGGKVLQAKVVSFVNSNGDIKTEFKVSNHPKVTGEDFYIVFSDIKKAIAAIKS